MLHNFWRRWRTRPGGKTKPASGRVSRNPVRLSVEPLEDRTLLATVNWIAGSGNWDVPANWSSGQLPGSGDDVVIQTASAATVAIDASDNVNVRSLTTGASATLALNDGLLEVLGGSSSLAGPLTLNGGGLTASGAGVTFTANGATSASLTNLSAAGGALLNLPQLTSYTANRSTFAADGAGSVLDVPALATATQQGYWEIDATNGGEVALTGLTSLGTAADSVFITDTGGSTLLDRNVTTLDRASVTLDGTDPGVANSWTSFTNGTLTVQGGSYNLGLTDIDGSILFVGPGSVSLPSLTGFSGSTLTGVEALGGGAADLPALTQVSGVPTILESVGAGSVLHVAALTSITGTHDALQQGERLEVAQGGTLDAPNLTSLDYENLTLDGTGTWSTSQLTHYTAGTLTLSGTATVTLDGITDADGASFEVSGGAALNLPAVSSYTGLVVNPLVYSGSATVLQASGAGSTLSLPGLTTLTGAYVDFFSVTEVQALAGGTVDLPALTQITGGDVVLESDGSNSLLRVPALAGFSSSAGLQTTEFPSTLQVTNSGTVQDGSLTTLDNVNLTLDATGLWSASQITSAQNGTIHYLGLVPASGNGLTVNVPQFPHGLQGLTISVSNVYATLSATMFNIPAFEIVILNTGTCTEGTILNVGQSSNVTLYTTVTGGATFNVSTNAKVELNGVFSGVFTGSGSGNVQLSDGGYLHAGNGGLTLDFPGSMFRWTDGIIDLDNGKLTNGGTVNIRGGVGFIGGPSNAGVVDNFGTINQVGGDVDLGAPLSVYWPTLINEAGASYAIGDNSSIDEFGVTGVGGSAIINAGTIRKIGGSGTSTLGAYGVGSLSNTGTIAVDSGTLALDMETIAQLSGTALTGGTWSALAGAALNFPSGTAIASNAGVLAVGGAGATIIGIAGLASNSGSLSLTGSADFTTAGAFSNSGTVTVGAGSSLTIAGAYSQTALAAVNVQLGGTPGSGQFGQLVVNDTATLAGSFNLSLVNGFYPSVGQQFNVISFASSTGAFAAFAGLAPYFTELLTPTAQEIVASAGAVDLTAASVTAPTTATTGQPITVNWQVSDPSSQAATGSWQDSVYVSSTPALTAASVLLGAVPRRGGLAAGGSYNASLSAALPALAPGNYYVLVQVDSLYQVTDPIRANNTLAAGTGPLAVSLATLTLGTPGTGVFAAADEDGYYQVSVPAGGALVVSLQSTASTGATTLYVSKGSLPTPYNYQESADVANQPNQTVTIPQVLTAGTYYILSPMEN